VKNILNKYRNDKEYRNKIIVIVILFIMTISGIFIYRFVNMNPSVVKSSNSIMKTGVITKIEHTGLLKKDLCHITTDNQKEIILYGYGPYDKKTINISSSVVFYEIENDNHVTYNWYSNDNVEKIYSIYVRIKSLIPIMISLFVIFILILIYDCYRSK